MRRILALLFAGTGLCIWWRYHRPERAGAASGFRCPDCGRVGESLDAFVAGAGYVNVDRPVFDRDRRTITRDNT